MATTETPIPAARIHGWALDLIRRIRDDIAHGQQRPAADIAEWGDLYDGNEYLLEAEIPFGTDPGAGGEGVGTLNAVVEDANLMIVHGQLATDERAWTLGDPFTRVVSIAARDHDQLASGVLLRDRGHAGVLMRDGSDGEVLCWAALAAEGDIAWHPGDLLYDEAKLTGVPGTCQCDTHLDAYQPPSPAVGCQVWVAEQPGPMVGQRLPQGVHAGDEPTGAMEACQEEAGRPLDWEGPDHRGGYLATVSRGQVWYIWPAVVGQVRQPAQQQ